MTQRKALVVGSMIDGHSQEIRKNVFLLMEDGIITAIDGVAQLPADLAVEDFSHCILIPPLVDCSVALARSPALHAETRLDQDHVAMTANMAMVKRHIGYCLGYGVLGVAENDHIAKLMDQTEPAIGETAGIDIRVPAIAAADGDFLKIRHSADIDDRKRCFSPGERQDLQRQLATRGQKKVVVIANGKEAVTEALAAGCDAIEQGYAMGEDNLRTMAARGTLWIPSIVRAKNALDGAGDGGDICCRFSQRYVAPGQALPGAEASWKRILTEQMTQLRLARQLGVATAIGTGAGNSGLLHGESVLEEMKLFTKAGYSPAEVVRCASENGANFFVMDRLGQVAIGKKATFLLTRGTAQQLPRKLAFLEAIYMDGRPSLAYRKMPLAAGIDMSS